MTEVQTNAESMQEEKPKRGRPKKEEVITVIANRRFGIDDPDSKRGYSRSIKGATGTGKRMVNKGEEATIPVELAKKLQESGVIRVKL